MYPIHAHSRAAVSGAVSGSALVAFILLAPMAFAGEISPPPGPALPVHELIQELEGDFSGMPEQDTEGGPRFGFSVAMYGDTLAVGAPGTRVGNIRNRGAVFVYRRVSGNWQLTQRLTPAAGSGEGQCGYAVAVDAYNLLIGCPFQVVGGQQRGRARLFTRSGPAADDFEFSESFEDSGDVSGAQCGRSVALIGAAESGSIPIAAVGCPGRGFEGGLATAPGAVDIYRYFLDGWQLAESLAPPTLTPTGFGKSVSLNQHFDNVLLVVGRPDTTNGQAQVYEMGAVVTEWNLVETYTGATDSSQFGFSVHMRGNRLVIGAPTRRLVVGTGGGAFVQVPVGSFSVATRSCMLNPDPQPPTCTWGEAEEFVGAPTVIQPIEQNRLGHAAHVLVGVNPARVIAGEPMAPWVNRHGRARHYMRVDGEWELNEDEPFYEFSTPAPSELGAALAADQGWLAIGAPGYPQPDEGLRGRVFLYAYNNNLFSDRFE